MLGFLAVFAIIFIILELNFFSKSGVSSVWGAIQNPNENMDVLVMGNSHAYTGLDTNALSQALGKNIQILGSGSQNMPVTYENLKVLLNYETPEYIILECFSAINNTKEYLQGDSRGLLIQNCDGIENYCYKADAVMNTFSWNTIPEGMFQLCRPVNMWTRWKLVDGYRTDEVCGYRKREKYIDDAVDLKQIQNKCKESSLKKMSLSEYNEKALKQFLELTNKKGIKVWIYKAPTLKPELSGYVEEIRAISSEYDNVDYVDDMQLVMTDIGLDVSDFYDTGHMNRSGAEKFTQYYGRIIQERLKISGNWDGVFAYESENVEKMADGKYRYSMKNYSNECLYRFRLNVNDEIVDETDYSENNTYFSEYDVRENEEVKLYCSMIPKTDAEAGDRSEARIWLPFMQKSECVIE